MPARPARCAAGASPRALAVLLALVAGVWQAVRMSIPVNDDFLHLALAQQLLGGDWPVRDFFDNGLTLQFTLSAASQTVAGHRLLSEALVVGAAWAVSTFLVFRVVQRLTGSALAGALSALLLIVAGPRGYSYPKVIVYAVAASLWWSYVTRPATVRVAAMGAWTAVAFYWRPDHGVYVGIGAALAVAAAHGIGRVAVQRCVVAGGVAIALTAPFVLLVQATTGIGEYVQTGFAQAEFQHEGSHRWPRWPVVTRADLFRIDAAEDYAPRMTLRWTAGSAPAMRQSVLDRYGLSPDGSEGPLVQRVLLSQRSVAALRELINEPIVEDTAGIDRSSASVPWSRWTPWDRWKFEHAWLRIRLLPGMDEHTRAGEAVAAVFYVLPALVLVMIIPMRRYLARDVTVASLLGFAGFAAVVTFGLVRTPYDVRAVDGVAIAAVLFGVCAAAMWRFGRSGGRVRRWAVTGVTAVFVLVTLKSAAVAGEFDERTSWLAGEWESSERMRGAWREVYERLTASPPLRFYEGRATGLSLGLAAYARECLPPSDRLLVLWFAPEIYYHSGRLAAQRHLVVVPAWGALAHEQRMTLSKVQRFSPPLVFAGASLDGVIHDTYPGVVDYVRREYDVAGSVEDNGERYLVLAKRGRPAVRYYGEQMWPCYQ